MPDDLAPLLTRISDLVEHDDDASEPLLARMEHTLTDGYAQALALEGESLRIERELVARSKRGEETGNLAALTDRLARAENDLSRLRSVLGALKQRAEGVRRSARGAPRRARS